MQRVLLQVLFISVVLLTSTNCKTFNKVFKTGGLIKVKEDHPKLTNGASGSEIFDKILCDKLC
jgi:hypothetical protein